MEEEYEIGDTYEFQLFYVAGTSTGLAWTEDQKLVIVQNCDEDDGVVKAAVEKIGVRTIMARKKGRVSRDTFKEDLRKQSHIPYEIDDEEDVYFGEDDDG